MRQDYRGNSWVGLCLVVTILVLSGLKVHGQAANTWSRKADFGGVARSAAVGFSIGNIGYIGTGLTASPNTLTDDFWAYDPATNTWSQKASFGGGARGNAVGFSIGDTGYIGTGQYAGADNSLNDFWAYNPATNSWSRKADFGGVGRGVAVGFSIGNIGYIGTGIGNSFSFYNDFWAYDPNNDTWSRKADFGGVARGGAVGFSIGNTGYIGTGYDRVTNPQNDFWAYNPATDTWSQKANFGGGGRYYGVGLSIGSLGYIGTGGDNSFDETNNFWAYDPAIDTWSQKADFGGEARQFGVGFSIGNTGYIGTGFNGPSQRYKDFWAYTPNANPMPVHLVSFSAKGLNNELVKLDWITTSEQNNDYFLIERSKDLTKIESIAKIKAHEGGSFLGYRYTHTDDKPYAGTSYYRLRQVDIDGKTTTYPWESVILRNESYGVAPNPINQQFSLQLDEPLTATIKLFTVEGRSVPFQRVNSEASSVQLKTEQKLSSGVYILTVAERAQTRQYRLVVE